MEVKLKNNEKTVFICSSCGYNSVKWYGKCPECSEWNSFEETVIKKEPLSKSKTSKTMTAHTSVASTISSIQFPEHIRLKTGLSEFDRVLGGGIVKGSAVLLSGEPGIGKSTLLLQICDSVCKYGKVLYVSGEESAAQIKLRATRLGVNSDNLLVLCETNLSEIMPEIDVINPTVVIIDSIQTMYDEDLTSYPGSVTQVKQCAMRLLNKAKANDMAIMIVGHVNKDGAIAGPKVVEHIVDAVLYFEGEKQHAYRIIRAAKNRFGSTNEIGVFEMVETGLSEVENPSAMLLSQRPRGVSGSCAVCVVDGTRPIIAEIQALVSPSYLPNPKRMSSGLDYNRSSLILAVLEKRLGYRFSTQDIYINVAGGLRIDEPSSDMATALALISSYKDIAIPDDVIVFGEIGLAGECRSVSHVEMRINEAVRLGFKTIAVPHRTLKNLKKSFEGVKIYPVRSVFDLLKLIDA
ncbi:MAG: DNA repair protein RadA [Eubacteriales bacterium]|nr:DNA repair protein RadA [Eubacteriales bacterium]MDD4475709.1 DNA repair protein RadA [Eubacteriales bacterium]